MNWSDYNIPSAAGINKYIVGNNYPDILGLT